MAKLPLFFILLFAIPIVNAVCTIPEENMEIRENAVLCRGTYNLESGIKINADNVSLDCNKSMLTGNGIGYGILLKNKNALIQNCNVSNYEIGIYLDNANGSIVKYNHLSNNKFGIALFNSFNNDMGDNVLAGNMAGDSITYFTASLIGEEKAEVQEENLATPKDVIEEVIKLKKPNLRQDEVDKEVDAILERYFSVAKENLEITRAIFFNETDGSTTIILNLKPKKILLNVSIYEKIPKCVSSYVNQVFFETLGHEVIKEDPLVLWSFARLDSEERIAYKVLKGIGEECKSLLFAFGIASDFREFEKTEIKKEKNKSYLFAALIVVLAGIALVYLFRRKSS